MQNSIHGIEIERIDQGAIFTADDLEFIDFTSGIFAASLGMFNEDVAINIERQAWLCMHAYQYDTPVKREYLKALKRFTGFESAYMFSSGTEATEAAWKICRLKTGKPGIWGLEPAFHGKTMGAQIAAKRIEDWRNQTPGEKTSCLIFEPYAAATCKFHPQTIIDRIVHLQKEFGLLLIADEIQAGFWRTGLKFGYMHYPELKPDLVCIGKAMCNGFPASAVLGPSELIDHPGMELSSTNGGNPLACAAGLSIIEQMETVDFLQGLQRNSNIFQDGLKRISRPTFGRGMVAAIHFSSVQEADDMVVKLKEEGLLVVHTKTNTIKLGPPLNIGEGDLRLGLKIIEEVVG
jgi:acetylornithine/succinyldiaminopimelate/putrescine aminotransferase